MPFLQKPCVAGGPSLVPSGPRPRSPPKLPQISGLWRHRATPGDLPSSPQPLPRRGRDLRLRALLFRFLSILALRLFLGVQLASSVRTKSRKPRDPVGRPLVLLPAPPHRLRQRPGRARSRKPSSGSRAHRFRLPRSPLPPLLGRRRPSRVPGRGVSLRGRRPALGPRRPSRGAALRRPPRSPEGRGFWAWLLLSTREKNLESACGDARC